MCNAHESNIFLMGGLYTFICQLYSTFSSQDPGTPYILKLTHILYSGIVSTATDMQPLFLKTRCSTETLQNRIFSDTVTAVSRTINVECCGICHRMKHRICRATHLLQKNWDRKWRGPYVSNWKCRGKLHNAINQIGVWLETPRLTTFFLENVAQCV